MSSVARQCRIVNSPPLVCSSFADDARVDRPAPDKGRPAYTNPSGGILVAARSPKYHQALAVYPSCQETKIAHTTRHAVLSAYLPSL